MLDQVLSRTAAKLAESRLLDAAQVAKLTEALTAGRPRSVAELSALLEKPADPAEVRVNED